MRIVKHNHLTPELIEKYTAVLAEAFLQNEFMYAYLMGKNPKVLRKFMKMAVAFNNHFADYYALLKDDGTWAAVVIYLPVGCDAIGVSAAIKRKKLLLLLQFFVAQPIKHTKRLMHFFDLENQYWYKAPFITLEVAGAIEKGCGKALIDATINNYNGQNIALNSSVDQNDHAYYRQFGFEAYKEFFVDHYKLVMMVRKA